MARARPVRQDLKLPRPLQAVWDSKVPDVALLVALIGVWHLVARYSGIPELVLPSPQRILNEALRLHSFGNIVGPTLYTLEVLVIGMVISIVLGIVIGVVIGMSPPLEKIATPYLWAIYAAPSTALVPVFIIWFGIGRGMQLWVMVMSAIIPMIISCADGVRGVDQTLLRTCRSFCGSRWKAFRTVILPATIPFIGAGTRQALSRGFVGLLVAEMLVSSGGLGTEVMRARYNFETAKTIVYTLLLIGFAMALISASRAVERFTDRWRAEVRI